MSTRLFRKIYDWLFFGQFLVLPGTCVVCRRATGQPRDLCATCEQTLPWLIRPCHRCGLPLPPGYATHLPCGHCLAVTPPFTRLLAPFRYDSPVSSLISGFKYHGRLAHGRVLSDCLLTLVQEKYRHQSLPDLILPVPLHHTRLRQRGFNQSAVVAGSLASRLNLPLSNRLCRRVKATSQQQGLSARQRKQNIHRAFQCDPDTDWSPYRKVAVVDDVVTTGTTVAEFSRFLKKQGVGEVHVWALARTCLD